MIGFAPQFLDGPPIPGTPINPDSPQIFGLAGCWPMWELAGVSAEDVSGNENRGTLKAGASWSGNAPNGKPAVLFNGSTGYVSVPSAPSLQPSIAVTCACWVYLTNIAACVLMAKDSDTNERAYTLDQNGAGGSWRFYINGGASIIVSSATSPTTGKWIHVCGNYDGKTIAIYLNGVLNASAAKTGAINTGNSTFQIAAREYSSARGFLTGYVADPRVYNRALCASEVDNLYNDPFGLWSWPRQRSFKRVTAQVWPYLDDELSGSFCPMGMGSM
jgi:concanavalin A-like lectin/glucanase superfamily protein